MNTHEQRVAFGAAMLAAFIGILALDFYFDSDLGLGCLGIIAGSLALLEFYGISCKKGYAPFKVSGLLCGILVFLSCWWEARTQGRFSLSPTLILLILSWLFLQQGLTRGVEGAMRDLSITLFGVFYIFFLLSFAMSLRHLPGGKGLPAVLAVLLMAKGSDIGAYLFGRKLGRHQLSPIISPNKTIEGALFGLLFSVLIAIGWSLYPQVGLLPLGWAVTFGLFIGLTSIGGDLLESIIKRDAGVKDSGSLIPGFGGLLDVVDCTLTSLPAGYYFLTFYQWKG